MKIQVVNLFTVDLEEWFHASLHEQTTVDHSDMQWHRVVRNTERILNMLRMHRIQGTFFVLGWVAEHYPELVRAIHRDGHEIASHGYAHERVHELSEASFEEDLQKSIHSIHTACGVIPKGYRAPSWSLSPKTPWFYKILIKNGFQYDSSVFPVRTFLYGLPNAPRFPFQPSGEAPILELPSSTIRFMGKNWPFAGGFYFRMLPYRIIRHCFRSINQTGQPAMFYMHPYELDHEEPRVTDLCFRDRTIQYFGRKRATPKLERLLREFPFMSIERYVADLKRSGRMDQLQELDWVNG